MSEPNRPNLTQAFRDGRVWHADVPFAAPWYQPLLHPILLVTNGLTASST